MSKLGVILSSCAALLLPGIALAQDASLEICNNGRADVDVAVAARIQSFITGYTWKTRGWYTVAAGTCATVYDEDFDDAGPYTPQSGARVAFTTLRPDGVWGAYHDDQVQGHGWMRSGTGQICVNHGDAFTFQEPAGDPAANCKGILIPVAHDFMPDGPGKFTYTMDWEGYGSFVPLGKGGQAKSTVASSSSSDSVDNSLSAQFLRALAQAAKDARAKAANSARSSSNLAVPVAAPDHASIKYLCSSTDPKQPAVYFSDIFEVPDAGSRAENFIGYERAKNHFETYLLEKYEYSGAENSVECGWMSTATTSNAAAAMAAKKRSMAAQVVAAKKRVIETGWKDAGAQVDGGSSNADATSADVEALNAKGQAAMLQWVREDLTAYIDASKTGFEAYKSGEAQLSQGYRMWTSSEKPALARGCWVIQGDSTSTFSCSIPLNKEKERAYYTQVTNDVTASLPPDWKPISGTPFDGKLPSTGYRSSSGAHGEIWLTETPSEDYELNYQIVSAPTRRQPPNPSDDDPIGEGGFITPPTPPAPPSPPN